MSDCQERGLVKRARFEILGGVVVVSAIIAFAWVKTDPRPDTEAEPGYVGPEYPTQEPQTDTPANPTGTKSSGKQALEHPSQTRPPSKRRQVIIPGLVRPLNMEPPPPLFYPEPPVKQPLSKAEMAQQRYNRVLRLTAFSHDHTDNHDAVTGALLALEALPDAKVAGDAAQRILLKALYAAYLTRREIGVLEGHYRYVRKAVYNGDGTRLATVSSDRRTRLWDPRTGAEIAKMEAHDGEIWDAVFTPNGRWLATASFDGTARIWNADTGAEIAVLRGHDGEVASLDISADGRFLATGSYDSTARIWDLQNFSLVAVLLGHSLKLRSVAFSPDGTRIATASDDTTVRLWDAATGTETTVLRGHTSFVRKAVFSPDGTRLASASADGTARLWRTGTGNTGETVAVLRGHKSWVNFITFSPDGARLATTSRDKTARLWNSADGSLTAELRGHGSWVNAATFSPNGERLLTASSDWTARLWNTTTGTNIAVLAGHQRELWSIEFSPDGHHAATASADGSARIWTTYPAGRGARKTPNHALWSDTTNGQYVVSIWPGGRAHLADAKTGAEIAILPGPAKTAAFSPDGQQLATIDEDGTAQVHTLFKTLDALAAALNSTLPRKLTRDQWYKYIVLPDAGD